MRINRAPRNGVMASAVKSSGFAFNRRSPFAAGLAAIAITFAAAPFGTARAADEFSDRGEPHWVGTWGASPQQPVTAFGSAPSFANQTVREILRISVGGEQFRVRLTNEFGAQPLLTGAAHVAISAGGAAIKPGTDRVLTFSGHSSITVPPGAPVLSDPVHLKPADPASLAISIYFPQTPAP